MDPAYLFKLAMLRLRRNLNIANRALPAAEHAEVILERCLTLYKLAENEMLSPEYKTERERQIFF